MQSLLRDSQISAEPRAEVNWPTRSKTNLNAWKAFAVLDTASRAESPFPPFPTKEQRSHQYKFYIHYDDPVETVCQQEAKASLFAAYCKPDVSHKVGSFRTES